ncbi:hypothetical protein BDW75DRAFT_236985 [Aspergillus navahoensis]
MPFQKWIFTAKIEQYITSWTEQPDDICKIPLAPAATLHPYKPPLLRTPRVIRSEIIHSTLLNLDSADTINRCNITSSTIIKTTTPASILNTNNPANILFSGPITAPEPSPSSTPGRITLKRSNITTSTLTNTSLHRSTITSSLLSNIPRARSVTATNSTLDNVSRLRRVDLSNTTVTEQSAMARSQAKDSLVSGSSVSRGSLQGSCVMKSRVRKSQLRDCDVSGCVIINTDFRGMVLRNGVWRNGRLVGCCGGLEGEGVIVNGKKLEVPLKSEKDRGSGKWMEGWESETESSDCLDSDSDNETDVDEIAKKKKKEEEDLPPPYTL